MGKTIRQTYRDVRVLLKDRRRSSANGNPRYRLVMETPDGTVIECTTRPDSSVAYALPCDPQTLSSVTIATTPSRRAYLDDFER